MSTILKKGHFTTLGPDEIWKVYANLHGIFRGAGSSTAPRLARADGPRRTDLTIRLDPKTQIEMVYPDVSKGLSFSDSVQTLANKAIEGQVWMIPRGTEIPDGLVFNVKDIDHPLLNVGRPMSVLDLMALLALLAAKMQLCNIKIGPGGKIIERQPGALQRVVNQ